MAQHEEGVRDNLLGKNMCLVSSTVHENGEMRMSETNQRGTAKHNRAAWRTGNTKHDGKQHLKYGAKEIYERKHLE